MSDRIERLEAAVKAGQLMRERQRQYFNEVDRNAKRLYLQRAKEAERDFDRLAALALNPQEGLGL